MIQLIRQERTQEHTVEETEFPVPHMMEKTIEVVKLIPQEKVQNRTMERIIDMPVMAQHQVQKRLPRFLQTEFIDKAVDVPVVMQRQVPTVQKVQKTAEVPQVKFIHKVVDAPVIMRRQVPAIQVAQKTVKDPETQSIVKNRGPSLKLDTRTRSMPGTSQTRIGGERNREWKPHSTLRTRRRRLT